MAPTIIAYDRFNQPQEIPSDKFSFRISANGILIEANRILLQRNQLTGKYGIPGGGIEIGESESSALTREFLEETGYKIKVGRLVNSCFTMFADGDMFAHNVMLFFEVKRLSLSQQHIHQEDSDYARFFDITSLDYNIIHPIYHKILKSYVP